jgi:PBP1b-binding outer membrane lipoprotein LpoB
MKKLSILICAAIVLAGCVPFKQSEVYPTVVANTTTKAWSLPVYKPPVQTLPTVDNMNEANPPDTVNPYLTPDSFRDIQSYMPNYIPRVGQTYWIPRFESIIAVTESATTFWTGTMIVGVNP